MTVGLRMCPAGKRNEFPSLIEQSCGDVITEQAGEQDGESSKFLDFAPHSTHSLGVAR